MGSLSLIHVDLTTKRAQLALRFFTYGVMTITTIILTAIVMLFALGYRLNRNFTFSQGGLVQFQSTPSGAVVTIDGKKQDFRTPNKANLPAGHHTISMSLAGYHDWQKTIDLTPGQLLWLNYTRLLPNTITTNTVREFDSISAALPSPDHRILWLQSAPESTSFTVVDVSNPKKPLFQTIQLPDDVLTKKDNKIGTIQLVEWDLSSRYMLLKHQNGDITEFVRVDRAKPADAQNLSRLFGLNILEAHFSGSNPNILFVRTDDVLRRLDLGATSASAAIASGVKQFVVYGEDSIAFDATEERVPGDASTTQQVISVYRHGKVVPVRTLGLTQQPVFAYSEYDTHAYLALGDMGGSRVAIFRDPSLSSVKESDMFAELDLHAVPNWLSFSDNGRMLLAQNGNTIGTYDIDEAKAYNATLDLGAPVTTQLQWLDDYYLWSDAGGQLSIVEFDGTNSHTITGIASGLGVLLTTDGHTLFSINKSLDGKFSLQTSGLVVGP